MKHGHKIEKVEKLHKIDFVCNSAREAVKHRHASSQRKFRAAEHSLSRTQGHMAKVPDNRRFIRLKEANNCTYFLLAKRQHFDADDKVQAA